MCVCGVCGYLYCYVCVCVVYLTVKYIVVWCAVWLIEDCIVD